MRGLCVCVFVILFGSVGCGSAKTKPAPPAHDRGEPLVVETPAPASPESKPTSPATPEPAPPHARPDDRDGDLIPDRCDACPDEPEVYNGDTDLDGCPDRDVLLVAQPFGPYGIPFKRSSTVPEKKADPTLDAIVTALRNRWDTGVEIVACAESNEDQGLVAKRQQWLRDQLISRGVTPSFVFIVDEPCAKSGDKDTHERWVRARAHVVKPTGSCPDTTMMRVRPLPAPETIVPAVNGKCKPGLCLFGDNKHCVNPGYHNGTGGTGPCSGCTNGRCDATRCAAPTTPIETPTGTRAMSELRVGDLVWSTDEHGRRVVAALAQVVAIPVSHHHVVHIVLDDGGELLLSPQHPIADGTPVGALHAGDSLPPRKIVRVEVVPYSFSATYDIRPATASGVYFSDGVALGSTLTGASK